MVPPGPPALDELRRVFAHLPLAVSLVDGEGRVRYANPAAEQLYGWALADVVGKTALALGVAPSETASAADLLARLQGGGEPWQGQFPLLRSDGSRVPAWVAVEALPADVLGETEPWLVITAVDLSVVGDDRPASERAAEGRAEEANLLLQGLLDSVPVGMAFFDRSLRFVRVNETMASFNGVAPERHVGRPIAELMQGLPDEVADDIDAVFATGEGLPQREVVWHGPAGPDTERVWLVSYFPVVRRGEVLWVGSIALEVTDYRRGERERARLLAAEREARKGAEAMADRLARLQIVTGRLAEVTTASEVADTVVDHGRAGVGASGGAMYLVEDGALRIVRYAGIADDVAAAYDRLPLDAAVSVADAVRTGKLVLLGSVAERDERYPATAGVASTNQSSAAVPMVVEGRAIGAIAFSWAERREFEDADANFLLALGWQAAQAVERSRLYEAERSARAEAEEAGERMRFLADASRVLSSSLDYDETLSQLADMAVPELADACLVHLVDDDELRLVVAAHRSADLRELLVDATGGPTRGRQPQLLGRAAVMGESIVLDAVPDDLLQRVAEGPEHLALLRSLDLRSGIVVPLRVQDRILGVLTFANDGSSGRRFGARDLPFVEDLAGRAAVAVENARSHSARSEVAQTLQRSLLPPHLPRIAGLELAQRYHSMGDDEVGGDFFDVFPAGDGRWGVAMGDVCGKGVQAAALTALARYTVRAGAIDGSPESVLRLLNRSILDADIGERFCTVAHAVVEPIVPDEGGGPSARLVLACGGHPLPLLLSASGEVRAVGVAGTALGLFEEVDLTEVAMTLGPGDALALYTDGFTEARSPEGAFDPGLLARSLATARGRTAAGIAEVLDQAVLAFEGGRPRDDMALLVLRVAPAA